MADLKCDRKEPSENNELIIDVLGVIRMSIQPFISTYGVKVT